MAYRWIRQAQTIWVLHTWGYRWLQPTYSLVRSWSYKQQPKIIANYFTDYVRQIGGVPRIVRADAGTENVYVAGMQRFSRSRCEDAFSGDKSFLYGKSVSNQRIEAWWSFLKKTNASWWIDFFKDMRDAIMTQFT